jgi:uncharacterized membrane protein (DUF4010 family)
MYIRILILVLIISPGYISSTWWWFVLLAIAGFGVSLIRFGRLPKGAGKEKDPEPLQNPFEIKPSIIFAVLFIALTVITGLVKEYFGESGLFTLSALVGITDITPFILSLINTAQNTTGIVTSAIIISMMSNTLVKAAYFGYLVPSQRKDTIIRFGILAILHIPFILIALTF